MSDLNRSVSTSSRSENLQETVLCFLSRLLEGPLPEACSLTKDFITNTEKACGIKYRYIKPFQPKPNILTFDATTYGSASIPRGLCLIPNKGLPDLGETALCMGMLMGALETSKGAEFQREIIDHLVNVCLPAQVFPYGGYICRPLCVDIPEENPSYYTEGSCYSRTLTNAQIYGSLLLVDMTSRGGSVRIAREQILGYFSNNVLLYSPGTKWYTKNLTEYEPVLLEYGLIPRPGDLSAVNISLEVSLKKGSGAMIADSDSVIPLSRFIVTVVLPKTENQRLWNRNDYFTVSGLYVDAASTIDSILAIEPSVLLYSLCTGVKQFDKTRHNSDTIFIMMNAIVSLYETFGVKDQHGSILGICKNNIASDTLTVSTFETQRLILAGRVVERFYSKLLSMPTREMRSEIQRLTRVTYDVTDTSVRLKETIQHFRALVNDTNERMSKYIQEVLTKEDGIMSSDGMTPWYYGGERSEPKISTLCTAMQVFVGRNINPYTGRVVQ